MQRGEEHKGFRDHRQAVGLDGPIRWSLDGEMRGQASAGAPLHNSRRRQASC